MGTGVSLRRIGTGIFCVLSLNTKQYLKPSPLPRLFDNPSFVSGWAFPRNVYFPRFALLAYFFFSLERR